MLQQTQVATVIPYFKKFMASFSTLEKLSQAPLDKVLQHWAGLGYYARGRNLHKTAQILSTYHQGKFPKNLEAVMALPGIGRSTAGAILAQAYNIRAPILDGNVKRVLCRFHCIDGWPGARDTEQELWELANFYTPTARVADYTQAIMDLGATLCTRTKPNCSACPLKKHCQAFALENQHAYPYKKPSKSLPTREITMLCVIDLKQGVLLQQRPLQGIWGGLWSLPEFDNIKAARQFLQQAFKLKKSLKPQQLPKIKHTFSHYHLNIDPWVVTLPDSVSTKPKFTQPNLSWVNAKNLTQCGLPAPIKKLLENIKI
jgi:A/G-specific adenine glycosylase